MSKLSFKFFSILFLFANFLFAQNSYRFSVDLTKVKNDLLMVNLVTPAVKTDEIIYVIPKIVPGTYKIYDFGRFISNFEAFTEKGEKLKVEKLDENRWKIFGAKKLNKISYWVEDTYDTDKENVVFEPAGTSIEVDKAFVINTHGFFGYLETMQRLPYEIEISKPVGFFGSTSMISKIINPATDRFSSDSYMELADSPILYARPDTTVLQVGGAEILISVYSPNKKLESKYVASQIKDILNAQKEYLGGKLPIKKYAFLIYLFSGMNMSGMMGALEHSYSSLYFLPEMSPKQLSQTIRDVAAHEFFHIVTPLSIHSEQIHNFDYINPQMSKHLWLYEGVIEYFASHVQIKQGLYDTDQYLDVLKSKMFAAQNYKQDLPFTELSSKCLEEHAEQYGNVYEKGALIGLCLDIMLNFYSEGKYNLRQLMADLAKEYGKEKAFKDEELFDKIVEISKIPQIKDFFKNHVEGSQPLPLEKVFAMVGISYQAKFKQTEITLGNIDYETQGKNVVIKNLVDIDDFGQEIGFQVGDILLKINGKNIDSDNYEDVLESLRDGKIGDPIVFEWERKEKNSTKILQKKITLQGTETTDSHVMKLLPDSENRHLNIRKAWIGK
ncbi:MAG: peptidase M61 [Bacteroidetes bacterium]|nr:MAG: peptidase M61 [Bacteroidota bacterium]